MGDWEEGTGSATKLHFFQLRHEERADYVIRTDFVDESVLRVLSVKRCMVMRRF